MSTRVYFDLATVADIAGHAVLADRTFPAHNEAAHHTEPQPALWYYRIGGTVCLRSNGVVTSRELATGRRHMAFADRAVALTTPCVPAPGKAQPIVFPLLEPGHRPLIDLLLTGRDHGPGCVALDPLTNTIGVGRRRRRGTRTRPRHPHL